MLTMPAYESFDEEPGYFGWTDNISLFTRQSLEPSLHWKVSGGASTKKRQRDSFLTKDGLKLSNQYELSAPVSIPMVFRFNSLRSGPFAATDPYIKSLFAAYDFHREDAEDEYVISAELEMHLSQLSGNHQDSLDGFISEQDAMNRWSNVDVPGEINSNIVSANSGSRLDKTSSLEEACVKPGFLAEMRKLWAKELQDELRLDNALSIGIVPLRDSDGLCDTESPIYEFPGKYGNPRRAPKPQKNFVLPPAYTSNSLDYMHI